MRRRTLTWLLLAMTGCEPAVESDLADEALNAARGVGVDYAALRSRALRRDPQAVAQLLRLSEHMDAAAALGHGCVLIEVAEALGDTALADACRPYSPGRRVHILNCLRAGLDYGHGEDPDRFETVFPLAAQALHGP